MTEVVLRGQKGLKSVKDLPVLQDGPPPGGYPAVRYARNIPSKGPKGITLFLVAGGVMAWGFYQIGVGNQIRREVKEEKMAARRAILPLIQAEEDARFVRERQKQLDEEAQIMANVPGWKVGENVYNSGRWMAPSTGKLGPFG
eukprot:TRINITY_DN7787_c0_g1_i1.p1 TRINITY_DN7787_c0_g1~~TRINITY_DN7787_c0_g1_i1.p1  ORF type:complete len:143 (-),score=29.61 TRINITY_DN7787_c0_g1_i1:671-1099(-)